MTREEQLEHIGGKLAQDLQEFVDQAIEASGNNQALPDTQAILKEWDAAVAGRPTWQAALTRSPKPTDEPVNL